jgi:hypothetical protein
VKWNLVMVMVIAVVLTVAGLMVIPAKPATVAPADPTLPMPHSTGTVVLLVTCLNPSTPDLSTPLHATTPDGTAVELWCGDRIEVSGGRCAIRLGDVVEEIPCTPEKGPRP